MAVQNKTRVEGWIAAAVALAVCQRVLGEDTELQIVPSVSSISVGMHV